MSEGKYIRGGEEDVLFLLGELDVCGDGGICCRPLSPLYGKTSGDSYEEGRCREISSNSGPRFR